MTAPSNKYGQVEFDPNDPNDALADRARQAVIRAFEETISPEDDLAPRQLEYTLAVLQIGVVQVIQAISAKQGDEADAAIRASIIQTAGWAVDMARSAQGREPLSDGN